MAEPVRPGDSVDRLGRRRNAKREAVDKGPTVRLRIGKGEYGTYFIGYSRTAAVTEEMLTNMFIGDPPGNTDHILEFSTAITGGKFFTPLVDFLNDPPPLPDSEAAADQPAVTDGPVSDGSLSIGSLKGTRQ